jgi:coenzyme F420-reducing hydrogenase beta subunit
MDFKFRDKSRGWGHRGKVVYEKNNKILEKLILPGTSYYYNYFLKGYIYRESCYECQYACSSRQGDITMGDFWGVENAHPEIETKKGVSVLLVNSEKGMDLIGGLKKYLTLTKSTFEQARVQNSQLNRPTAKSNRREEILKTWREGGYRSVADEYYRMNKKQIALAKIKMLVPNSIKLTLIKTLKIIER